MKIEQRTAGHVTILKIGGDMLFTGKDPAPIADRVRHEIQLGHTRLVLDLGRVHYIDSTGLGELINALLASRNRGGALKLINVNKRVNDLLVVMKLLTVFERYETEAEALASFEPQAAQVL